MKSNNSNVFPFLTGLLVGGAAIYFLKSDKGQQMVDLAMEKGENVRSTIIDNSKEIMESSQKAINKAVEKSTESFNEFTEGAKNVAHTKMEELDLGIQKARNKIADA